MGPHAAYTADGCIDAIRVAASGAAALSVADFAAAGDDAWQSGERFPTVYCVVDRVGSWREACRAAGLSWKGSLQDQVALRARGLTYAEIASEVGGSTQRVWMALRPTVNGVGPAGGRERFAVRWGPMVELEFRLVRNSRLAASAVGVSERLTRRHLQFVGLASLDLPASQVSVQAWEAGAMVELLRRFVASDGVPATLGRLAAWAERTGERVPSYRTWLVRFGSWRAACEAAGVPSGEPTRDFTGAVDVSACRAAVQAYLAECGQRGVRPTMTGYEAVSSERGWPCRNTVVLRLGSWREAVAGADPNP